MLQRHPTLHLDALELAFPPPVMPTRTRVRRWGLAVAIAASFLLAAMGATFWPDARNDRPGPTENGHAAYAFVVPTGPMITGSESYAWEPRPPAAESYDYTMPEPPDPRLATHRPGIPSRWL